MGQGVHAPSSLTPTGIVVASATVEHSHFASPEIGWAEQDANDWWRASAQAIRQVLDHKNVNAEEIGAIGFSGQMQGAVFLNEAGETLRPSIIWCDQRTEKQCHDPNQGNWG